MRLYRPKKTLFAKFIILLFIVFAFFSLSGCQSFYAPKEPDEMWNPPDSAKKTNINDPVWKSIRGQEILPSEPLDLVELIDIALENNPSTRQTWADAKAAQAELKQAQSDLYPSLTITGEIERQRILSTQAANKKNQLQYGAAGKITYLLLDFGGRGADIGEAYQALLAANFQFNQKIQDLLLDVEKAYFELNSAISGLEAAKADIKASTEALDLAKNKFEVGLNSELDFLQERSNYDDSLYNLEEAKSELESAKANLAQVLGFPADAQFEIAQPTQEIPEQIDEEYISQLIDEALENRQDIASLRANLKAKKEAVKSANSDLWPSVSIEGNAGRDKLKYYDSDASSGTNDDYSVAAVATWDAFDGFDNLNKKRQAQAEFESARQKLISAELDASAQVWSKFFVYKASIEQFTSSKTFFNSSEVAYQLAQESYKVGLKSILDLLNAESNLSSAQSKLIASEKDLFIALADLAHSTGTLYVRKNKIDLSENTEYPTLIEKFLGGPK